MSGTTDQHNAGKGNRPMPPACPGVRHVKVPLLGLIVADDDLRARIDRTFHKPMLILALLVLPLLAIELFWLHPDPELKGTALWWTCTVAFFLIWAAFLIEFVIKITIAESRVEYLKRNWLDVIIIILPLLRPLRAATLARTSKVFTLRGVGTKAARYVFSLVLGLEATERLLLKLGLKSPKGRRKPAEMTRHQLMREVKKLRKLEDAWEAWYDAHQEHLDEYGHDRDFTLPVPHVDDIPDEPDSEGEADHRDASVTQRASKSGPAGAAAPSQLP